MRDRRFAASVGAFLGSSCGLLKACRFACIWFVSVVRGAKGALHEYIILMISQVLADALRQLTHLRRLCLCVVASIHDPRGEYYAELSGSIIGGALAILTELRSVRISDFLNRRCRIRFDKVQPLFDACTHLHVSQLVLCLRGVTGPLLVAVLPEMPTLKSVSFAEIFYSARRVNGLEALHVHAHMKFPSVCFRFSTGWEV